MAESPKERIARALRARLGPKCDSLSLAEAYMKASDSHALSRTLGVGPVASSIAADRAELMINVSRELGRLVDRTEIEALLRIPAAAAGSVHKLMVATYTDDAGPLQIAWCLQGAYEDGVGTHGPVTDGHRVVLADRDRLETLAECLSRDGVVVVVKTNEPELRHLVVIDQEFDLSPFALPAWTP